MTAVASQADDRVMRVTDIAETGRAIRQHYRRGVPIHFEGAGNRLAPLDPNADAIVIRNDIRDPIERVSEDELRITTGWRWLDVLAYLERHDLAVPVLTSNLNATVGGTLATGGIGLLSHRHGVQADHVSGCTIHSAIGTFDCCRSEDPLWRASLCSLGAIGFVSAVTLKVRPGVGPLAMYERAEPLRAGLARFVELAGEEDLSRMFVACRLDHGVVTTRVGTRSPLASGEGGWDRTSVTPGALARLSTPASIDAALRLWNDYIVPVDRAMAFLEATNDTLGRVDTVAGLRTRVRAIGLASAPDRPSDPYLRPRARRAGRAVGVGFYIDLAVPNEAARRAAGRWQAHLKQLCFDAGGAPYKAGAFTLSDDECHAAYGTGWPACREVKRQHDPDGLFGIGSALPFDR